MDTDVILAHIRAHEPEEKRRRRLYDYYVGRHDILRRSQDDPSKPNNRLCCGYPALIANAYAGYLFGEPVNYQADGDLMANISDTMKYNDEAAENMLLGLDMGICGMAVEIHYTDADARERFRRVDPVQCIAVYDDSIDATLTALIRYYDTTDVVTNKTMRHVEVYEAEGLSRYELQGGKLEQTAFEENYFGDVAAVVYRNNSFGTGDFEGVMTLIDAYDLMQSEGLNDQEYFSDAYLMLQGLEGTEDADIAAMKRNRVLLVPQDADAKWLIKQQSDALIENMKNRLNSDIHRFSGCPDMSDEHFAGNASGVALKYKLLQFENIAGVKEREFKRGLQRRIELLCTLWEAKGRGTFDWRDVQISFKRALPENLLELSQTLSNLGSLLSDATKRGMLPMDLDEEVEETRIREQREVGMSLYTVPEGFGGLTDG